MLPGQLQTGWPLNSFHKTSFRQRLKTVFPITLSAVLAMLNVALMVCWIVLLAHFDAWSGLAIGTVVFALTLLGLMFYSFLHVKETRLNQRQANFIDSVTHELKSPIASLRLYLETLQLRPLPRQQQEEFYATMASELHRLDELISQLLEVARLDALGHGSPPEDIPIQPVLERCARWAAEHQRCNPAEVFDLHVQPATIRAVPMVLEMIFRNLLDNAVKYGGRPPKVIVEAASEKGKVRVRVIDNGHGVPEEIRGQIFGLFVRGGRELERKQKGTGLGLYIVHTLVRQLRGTVRVLPREDGERGCIFEVVLPAGAAPCDC